MEHSFIHSTSALPKNLKQVNAIAPNATTQMESPSEIPAKPTKIQGEMSFKKDKKKRYLKKNQIEPTQIYTLTRFSRVENRIDYFHFLYPFPPSTGCKW